MKVINGVEYDSPLSTFATNSEDDRKLLKKWKKHFEKLGIYTHIEQIEPDKVELFINREQNRRKWSCECKCGDRVIYPPDPWFGLTDGELSQGSPGTFKEVVENKSGVSYEG